MSRKFRDGRTVFIITVSHFSEGSLFIIHCVSLSLPPLRYYVAEGVRIYSQDLEGGHTDQGSAAGRAAHPQSGEFLCLEQNIRRASRIYNN